VSNTPRTDSMRGFHGLDTAVDAEFSEQLECELAAAQQRIKRLEEVYAATEAVRTIRECWCYDHPDLGHRCNTCCDKIKRYHTAKANLNQTEEAKEDKL